MKKKTIWNKNSIFCNKIFKYYYYTTNNIIMLKKYCVVIACLLLITPSMISITAISMPDEQNSTQAPTSYGKGYRYNIMGWVYIHIEGEPFERGYQYGYLAADEIVDMMNRWSNWGYTQKIFKRLPMDVTSPRYDDVSALWWEYCKSKAKRWFLGYYPEEYIEEMKGVAAGVKDRGGMIHGHPVEFDDILANNEVVDCWFSYEYSKNGFHPIRGAIQGIKNLFSKEQSGSCSAFIATGDATTDGGIIIAHSTHVPRLYIPERFNILLDVKPSTGNRFIMACPPGTITSMTDYYQNEKGIVLTETTYPQGPWKKNGVPIPVRSRLAIQYSDSIDEVIKNLKDGNNGIYACEWLIGDTKTGEIASIELALFNNPIKRTNNGFYWSCNYPHDKKVKREIYGIPLVLYQAIIKIFPDIVDARVYKFREIEREYYGEIDLESGKTILGTSPICKPSSDGKITSSKLMENFGFLAYMGNPNGTTWTPTGQWENTFKGITDLPSVGWVKVYPPLSNPNYFLRQEKQDEALKESMLLWQSDLNTLPDDDYSSITISDNTIFTGSSSGKIKAMSLNGKDEVWTGAIDGRVLKTSVSKDMLYVGSDKGIFAVDKETGRIKWKQDVGVVSKPVFNEDLVIVSSSDGGMYGFDSVSGKKVWEQTFSHPAYLSEVKGSSIYVGSDDTCYSFDVDSNKLLWKKKTDGPITASPCANDKMVFVGSWDGCVYALDSSNGDVKWSYETGWGIDSTPIVANGKIFVGGLDNNFYALDAGSGESEWFFACKSAIHSSPIVYGEYVFFGCDDGKVYALDRESGSLAWSFAPGYFLKNDANSYLTTAIHSDPFVDEGVVYFEVEDTVYALDPQTDEIIEREVKGKPAASNGLLIILLCCLIVIALIMVYMSIFKKRGKR